MAPQKIDSKSAFAGPCTGGALEFKESAA